jgi:predicted ribosome quality control (RQC) complex YloA/Tae2 family protein
MRFREFLTDRNTLIFGGKNAENNEELIEQAEKSEEIFHTDAPGSPFVNIKGKPKKGDIKQAAIFCAAFSKDWKKNKKDVIVHRFKKKDIYKTPEMKTGTFGVKNITGIKIRKKEIEKFLREWEK